MLKTKFWQQAASRLPEAVRTRHLVDLQRAERVEILVDGLIEAWSLVKHAIARAFAPRATPQQH